MYTWQVEQPQTPPQFEPTGMPTLFAASRIVVPSSTSTWWSSLRSRFFLNRILGITSPERLALVVDRGLRSIALVRSHEERFDRADHFLLRFELHDALAERRA